MESLSEDQKKLNAELAKEIRKTMPGMEQTGVKFAYIIAGFVVDEHPGPNDYAGAFAVILVHLAKCIAILMH